jgi:hypothetical protein
MRIDTSSKLITLFSLASTLLHSHLLQKRDQDVEIGRDGIISGTLQQL